MGLFRVTTKRHERSWATVGTRIPAHALKLAAKELLASVRNEIDRERALEAGKGPGGLPRSPKFKNSFKCLVVGDEIQIVSNWPTLDALVDGKKPYRMTWLTHQAGVNIVPMEGPNESVIYRTTPQHKGEAWMHPGFRKHEFLTRAIDRAWPKMVKIVSDEIAKVLSTLFLV